MNPIKSIITSSIIKDGTDNLPAGLCFFDENEILVLCNRKMSQIIYYMYGRNLQTFAEIDQLTEHVLKLADGSAWLISKTVINDTTKYTQFLASEVTELNENLEKIREKRDKLSKQASHLLQLNKNLTAIVREEEVLSMKMRVHNQMGSAIIRTNQYYRGGCDPAEKTALIKYLRNTYLALSNGTMYDEEESGFEELVRIAASMELKLTSIGEISFQNDTYKSICFSAIGECITNAVRHGKAQNMFVIFEHNAVTITNDGVAPADSAHEGGGLTSLRDKVSREGGNISIQFVPSFILNINWRKAE